MAFHLSREVVEGVLRLKPDWVRPRGARRDVQDGLLSTIAGYAAEKRAGGLPDGKGTTLLAAGSIEREFRDTMRKALGLYDALIGRMTVELRDWTLKARGRTREYPWGKLFAEGEWLWVIPKAQPLDAWATTRTEAVVLADPRKFKKAKLEILVRGPAGSGKSTFAQEIGVGIKQLGFEVIINDNDGPASDAMLGIRLGSLSKFLKTQNQAVYILTVQTKR